VLEKTETAIMIVFKKSNHPFGVSDP
jgi:hypothetical protein